MGEGVTLRGLCGFRCGAQGIDGYIQRPTLSLCRGNDAPVSITLKSIKAIPMCPEFFGLENLHFDLIAGPIKHETGIACPLPPVSSRAISAHGAFEPAALQMRYLVMIGLSRGQSAVAGETIEG